MRLSSRKHTGAPGMLNIPCVNKRDSIRTLMQMQAPFGKIEQNTFTALGNLTLWLPYTTLLILHSVRTLSLGSLSEILRVGIISSPTSKCKNISELPPPLGCYTPEPKAACNYTETEINRRFLRVKVVFAMFTSRWVVQSELLYTAAIVYIHKKILPRMGEQKHTPNESNANFRFKAPNNNWWSHQTLLR